MPEKFPLVLSSQKKRILLVSDPHQNMERLEYILKKENYDQVLCLGDWFDSFDYNTDWHCENTAAFLKKFIFTENRYTLWGNHDVHYFFDNPTVVCSGYGGNKQHTIDETLGNFKQPIAERFRWFAWVDDYLCTHAGVHPYHFHPLIKGERADVTDFLLTESNKANADILINNRNWLYGAGAARGGRLRKGGLIWLDWNYEFQPIPGINQIVGHTNGRLIREKHQDNSKNYNIDCDLDYYLIAENGVWTPHALKEL